MLVELQPQTMVQGKLELPSPDEPPEAARDHTELMTAFDALNRRYGCGAVSVASGGVKPRGKVERPWATKFERRTPRYTTRWEEMPIARA